jgi:hypothetical protein
VTDQYTPQDPTTQYPQPNFGEQKVEHPGLEPEMQPEPDYGYETYRGSGRLEGKKAIITGVTQGSDGPSRSPSPARVPTS